MGCAQQAVLEFDEEVRAPWRPRLVPEIGDDGAAALRAPRPQRPSRPSPSRVGVCRPPAESRPVRSVRPQGPTSGLRAEGASGGAVGPVRSRRPPVHHPRQTRPRLTRRARRLAAVLTLGAGVALASWVGPLLTSGGEGDLRLVGVRSVVVEPGDTLWSIATSLDADGDVRGVIDEIQELNDLESVELVPGQTLQLP